MANTVKPTTQAPAAKKDYDPIQMLRDFLNDNPGAPAYLSNYLINRLGDQIIWYDKKSAYFKSIWEKNRVVIIVLSAAIPFLVGLIGINFEGVTNPTFDLVIKLVVGAAGVTIAILESLNSLYKSQEIYVDYRVTAEQLKQEFCYFLGKSGTYEGLEGDKAYSKLIANTESIMGSENNRWAEIARQNEKAIQASDIQNAMQEFMKKHGIESFAPPKPENGPDGKEE